MKRTFLVASALAIGLLGCKRDDSTPTATTAATPAETPALPDLAGAGVQPNAAGFSSKAFAGTFHGTLPCADCPGIDETLELKPDGSFKLTDAYRDRPAGTQVVAGSWTSEERDTHLRLDPNSKGEQDRLFAIGSGNTLTVLGNDGQPAGGPTQILHRTP
ncbi:MAG: hypothetical protein JWL98_2031 [Xanthomonadaceae bacterium]|nr:hypothetical protein [Xanthomonadaceae bacterium]